MISGTHSLKLTSATYLVSRDANQLCFLFFAKHRVARSAAIATRSSYRLLTTQRTNSNENFPPPPPPPSLSPQERKGNQSQESDHNLSHEARSAGHDIELFRDSQQFSIRMMLGVSFVNAAYWGSSVIHSVLYKGIVVDGINLAGDPTWGYVGMFATGFLLFFSRSFAHHSCYRCYESADRKRIGFQVHTMLGNPGRKFEVAIGNARFASNKKYTALGSNVIGAELGKGGFLSSVMRTSMVPIRVEGIAGNILLDQYGTFNNDKRLIQLVERGSPTATLDKEVDSKDQRTALRKASHRSRSKHSMKK